MSYYSRVRKTFMKMLTRVEELKRKMITNEIDHQLLVSTLLIALGGNLLLQVQFTDITNVSSLMPPGANRCNLGKLPDHLDTKCQKKSESMQFNCG